MSDLQTYVKKRKRIDPEFAENFEQGYADFKVGARIKQLRKAAGLTQEALARKLKTKKSAISRIENQAEDIRLSTLIRIATILGRKVTIDFSTEKQSQKH